MDRFQMGSFQLTRNPNSNDLLLLVKGPTLYKDVLHRAFPGLRFSRTFADRYGRFDWGTYVAGVDGAGETAVRDLCGLLRHAVLLDDDLDESFALAFHKQMSPSGGSERTSIGQLVRECKPYNQFASPGDRAKAITLAQLYADFIRLHPTYCRATLLAAVPASNSNKPFDLPAVLADEIAKITGQTNVSGELRKTRPTRPMKEFRTVQEKIENLRDAFAANPNTFAGRPVILIDDIYQTGFSINEAARAVASAGATPVLGLVATKTAFDLPDSVGVKEGDDDIPF